MDKGFLEAERQARADAVSSQLQALDTY